MCFLLPAQNEGGLSFCCVCGEGPAAGVSRPDWVLIPALMSSQPGLCLRGLGLLTERRATGQLLPPACRPVRSRACGQDPAWFPAQAAATVGSGDGTGLWSAHCLRLPSSAASPHPAWVSWGVLSCVPNAKMADCPPPPGQWPEAPRTLLGSIPPRAPGTLAQADMRRHIRRSLGHGHSTSPGRERGSRPLQGQRTGLSGQDQAVTPAGLGPAQRHRQVRAGPPRARPQLHRLRARPGRSGGPQPVPPIA